MRCRATESERCHVLGGPVRPAGVTSKLINQSRCGDLMQCTFNWAKFLPSVDLRFPPTRHYCMCLDVVGSRPLKRPHQLGIARRQAHSTSMGRQAERSLQEDQAAFFLCRQICHEASICLTCQNLKGMKVRQAGIPISQAFWVSFAPFAN